MTVYDSKLRCFTDLKSVVAGLAANTDRRTSCVEQSHPIVRLEAVLKVEPPCRLMFDGLLGGI